MLYSRFCKCQLQNKNTCQVCALYGSFKVISCFIHAPLALLLSFKVGISMARYYVEERICNMLEVKCMLTMKIQCASWSLMLCFCQALEITWEWRTWTHSSIFCQSHSLIRFYCLFGQKLSPYVFLAQFWYRDPPPDFKSKTYLTNYININKYK